jgi:universal stress protein A
MKPDSILIPMDFSEPSHKAFRYGLELANKFDAAVHLLHVTEEMVFYSPTFGGYMPSREQYAAYAESGLANVAATEPAEPVSIKKKHCFGKPATEIVKYAAQEKCSLIVIGTHGGTTVRQVVLGNVAENVVRNARCPVLTVHAEQHEFIE